MALEESDLERMFREKLEAEEAAAAADEAVEKQEATEEPPENVGTLLDKQGYSLSDQARHKNRYGKIYYLPWTDDKVFVFRTLIRKEWNMIRGLATGESEMQELLLKTAVLWPDYGASGALENELAGIQDSLSQVIMRISGFVGIEEALSGVREL